MEQKIIDTKYHSISSTTSSITHQKNFDLLLILEFSTYRGRGSPLQKKLNRFISLKNDRRREASLLLNQYYIKGKNRRRRGSERGVILSSFLFLGLLDGP